jgi:hypothetical protein
MKTSLFLPLSLALLLLRPCFAQDLGEDVEGLNLVELSPTTVRLNWKPVEVGHCEKVVYSVFHGNTEDFAPSLSNRIASRITKNSYVVKEPTSKVYYYYVKALTLPTQCSMGSADAANPSIAGQPTQSSNQPSARFPAEDQISLLLTQSERALESYERAVKMENLILPKQGADADAQVATQLRQTVAKLKGAPQMFNSPYGFILIANLDDASRNMAVCIGQGWMQALSPTSEADLAMVQQKVLLSQTCLDTSTLLYTVSETASDMYSNYLLADYQLNQRATVALNRCAEVMKKANSKQSQIPTFAEWQKQQQAKQAK